MTKDGIQQALYTYRREHYQRTDHKERLSEESKRDGGPILVVFLMILFTKHA